MKENHSIALIVSYYLSKYDRVAYDHLGFGSVTQAHRRIGEILKVKPNSIKNMRDEFDPYNDNPRVGWYQRPLRPSRAKVVEAFQQMTEEELRDVALELLTNPAFASSPEFGDIIFPVSSRRGKRRGKAVFVPRGPTGRKAEEAFIAHHAQSGQPIDGLLVDLRDTGCGYDFEVRGQAGVALVEVKGLDGDSGGILFTSKEWDVANSAQDSYFLVLVRNVSTRPRVHVLRNPASWLKPTKSIYSSVQVRWAVPDGQLSSI